MLDEGGFRIEIDDSHDCCDAAAAAKSVVLSAPESTITYFKLGFRMAKVELIRLNFNENQTLHKGNRFGGLWPEFFCSKVSTTITLSY